MHFQLLLAFEFAAYTLASFVPDGSRLAKRQSVDYGYTGLKGPLLWGDLSPDYAICSTGNNQSPINIGSGIPTVRVTSVSYPYVQSATAENTGKTIQIDATKFNPRGTLTFNNKVYLLENIHVHTPSEHRLFEEHFPLETHFVHRLSGGNELLVVGIFAELVKPGLLGGLLQTLDAVVNGIVNAISQIKSPGSSSGTGSLDLRPTANFIRDTPLYQYDGSLTTPPCDEGVTWLVANRPVDLDIDDYNAIKDVVKFNARYTQNAPGQDNLLEAACS